MEGGSRPAPGVTLVYLAGPEVFLAPADRDRVREAKLRSCADRGWTGLFPAADPPEGDDGPARALALFDALRTDLDRCDAGIANLTPFRGPSADAGTVWEVGYLVARGVPVLGYTNHVGHYGHRAGGLDDHHVEAFDLTDNLMVDRGIWRSSGVEVVRTAVAPGDELIDLRGFDACCRALAGIRTAGGPPPRA